jgi:hypothetical protein
VQSSRRASRFPLLQPSPDSDSDQAVMVRLSFEFESLKVEHLMSHIALHGVLSPDHRPLPVVNMSVSISD